MAEVKIRSSLATDLPLLAKMDHGCSSEYVWQMDIQRDEDQFIVSFREIRLPRAVRIEYPRPLNNIIDEWRNRGGMLTAQIGEEVVGYLRLNDRIFQGVARILDLVVAPPFRRKGVATSLMVSAQAWALDRHNAQVMLEMSSKNFPAICLARKLGYEFCGYNDHYYPTRDVALFFHRSTK